DAHVLALEDGPHAPFADQTDNPILVVYELTDFERHRGELPEEPSPQLYDEAYGQPENFRNGAGGAGLLPWAPFLRPGQARTALAAGGPRYDRSRRALRRRPDGGRASSQRLAPRPRARLVPVDPAVHCTRAQRRSARYRGLATH